MRPRKQHLRTECVHGHPYVEGSFRVTKAGFKVCLSCNSKNQKKFRAKNAGRPMAERKKCGRCGFIKSSAGFTRSPQNRDGLASWCKACNRNAQRDREYGLEEGQFQRMLTAQGGMCAICGDREIFDRELSVDHDHLTGVVRGLLCTGCNRLIGQARDDPERLRSAAEYLEASYALC